MPRYPKTTVAIQQTLFIIVTEPRRKKQDVRKLPILTGRHLWSKRNRTGPIRRQFR
jgi:hypothetical protein